MANKQPDYGVRPCCVPDCNTRLPRTQELPVCRECGIKIAVAHMWDAERLHAVTAERLRRIEAHRARVRAGQTRTSTVYYLDMGDCIKIGFSTNLDRKSVV